ncbi:MAG: SDR family oxidoreductase [Desulfovibrio sp.]|nr:MAG: SDR family oxidoreductase [Desulfovibrio sp.]
MKQNILITGASGGFGNLTVNALLQKGHRVIASMRGVNGKNASSADELKAAGAHVVELDVTNDNSVNQGVAEAIDLAGGLDVVINNAGVGVLGLMENFTIDDVQKVFDINVFGVQRVNRAVLPHLRDKNSGLIIHISSLLGRMCMPFFGAYNASKWALEALAENYRVELSGFGVDVAIVEPGGYPTTFNDNLLRPSDSSRDAGYGDFAQAPMQSFQGYEQALAGNPAQNPQDVADAVANLVDTPAGQRPFRTVVDKMGMGDPINGYNDQLEQIMTGIYSAFGMGGMLTLNV